MALLHFIYTIVCANYNVTLSYRDYSTDILVFYLYPFMPAPIHSTKWSPSLSCFLRNEASSGTSTVAKDVSNGSLRARHVQLELT